ncbi:MAG TPA: extracellular solute-binding protein, partial [Spirochaetia bacterium]|nr:extracellular solute-binding protein [Spirochaetia bacterium]
MKKFIAILSILFLLVSFAVFSGGQSEQKKTAEKEEPKALRIKSVAWLTQKAFIGEAADDFMKQYPDVKITFESFADEEVQKLMILWASGKSDTDIAVVQDPSGTTGFVIKDLIYNYDDLGLWKDFSKDKLLKSFLDIATIKDKVYYLPIMGEVYTFNINKITLKEAGVIGADGKVPELKDWDDLIVVARKTKAIT